MKKIPLGDGVFALVDAHHFDRLNKWKWYRNSQGYAVRAARISDGKKSFVVRMHHEVLNCPVGMEVDHRNMDKLDNRASNLRLSTHQQNNCNKSLQTNSTSGFKGANYDKSVGLWKARIKVFGKVKYLGSFGDAISAAVAYDHAAEKYHGEFASLNFPWSTTCEF